MIGMTLREGKIIHGHTAGARDRKLSAIAAASVSSCHEPISEMEVLERLRLGFWVMLRQGTFRHDIEATLRPLVARGLSTQRLILVTDGVAPDDTEDFGHIDFVVRRAIGLGLSPVQAIQAVTLNPATYSGLEQEIGGIAPGRFADLTLLEDLEKVRVHSTLIGGRLVARGGESLVGCCPISLPGNVIKSIRLKPPVSPDALKIPCPSSLARIRVMELLNVTITLEKILELSPKEGVLVADQNQDLVKVAAFDRHGDSGRIALGFLKGFGARVGAVGTTVNLDENSHLIVGSDDSDMALCANLLI